ncbi:UbiA-like protein EboC [Nodularia sphaerocarpa]|nr:UbiA-like protein EboC [Nodularia sphaerocarpa]MDB9372741.1 UbiA-like protein EboC [Nodularia sphaerocarpa CS-585]MDB9376551.1 UbiA-like protein EboC [Nodularia sphaerocarpa CS-585A2]ULP70908.1 4-hydroxybenzoate octaprenyltransferase [Nodularia sphaerocarpa UHCC 0038]
MNTAILKPHRLWAYLQLMRPANIVTAWADILAGFAASQYIINNPTSGWQINLIPLAWLLLATTGLYGGGIVFNDVFDTELDTQERPERPIPSGRASQGVATLLGSWLLSIGIVAASQISWLSTILALSIALAALCYNAFGKHHQIFGPINMGICRGGNLLLGVSVVPATVGEYWFLALIPIVYIAAITLLSRGEVHGAKVSTGVIALLLIIIVIIMLLGLGLLTNYQIFTALPFLIFFTMQVLLPFIKAVHEPTPEQIRFAVKAGILSLIILDTSIVAGFAGWTSGLIALSLLPISIKLAQIFAVT